MNYLDLCNKVIEKAGITNSFLTDVTNPPSVIHRVIINFVKEAWIEIQTDPGLSANFLYKFNQVLQCQAQNDIKLYTYQDFNLNSDIEFNYDKFFYKKDLSDKTTIKLNKLTYYDIIPNLELTSTPVGVVGMSLNSFYLLPTNKDVIYLYVDYYDAPQELINNDDVPNNLNTQDQMIIVWKALMSYGFYDEAQEILQQASMEYQKYYSRLFTKYNTNSKPTRIKFGKF